MRFFFIVSLNQSGMKRACTIFTWNSNPTTAVSFDRGSTWKTISYIYEAMVIVLLYYSLRDMLSCFRPDNSITVCVCVCVWLLAQVQETAIVK
jgi:hypothetical protein